MTVLARWLALWFGAGLSPKAPGTVGSLAALPCAYGLTLLGGPYLLAAAALVLIPLGVWAAARETAVGETDPGRVVIDEVAGQWIALIPAAAFGGVAEWIVAFLAFRALDILKPGPIGWADRNLHGGWGIMMDDVIAGIGAAAIVWLFFVARALPYGAPL